jgi:hypothetical protein
MNDEQRQAILDFKNTFSTQSGLRVLDKLKVFCGGHVNIDNFDPDSERRTSYNLGRNRVYRYILSMIEYEFDKYNEKDCINAESGE